MKKVNLVQALYAQLAGLAPSVSRDLHLDGNISIKESRKGKGKRLTGRMYRGRNCKIQLRRPDGKVTKLNGVEFPDRSRYITHEGGWRNAERFAKKSGLELV